MKKKKYVYLLLLLFLVTTVVFFTYNKKESSLFPDFGTDKFTIDKFKEECTDVKLYEDQYILSEKNWMTNIVTGDSYSKDKESLNKKIKAKLSSDDPISLQDEMVDSEKNVTQTYSYKGNNLFMFEFDTSELSVLIQNDLSKTKNMDELTRDDMNKYLGLSFMLATELMLGNKNLYKESEEREIIVMKDDEGKITNGNTLYYDLLGMNSERVLKENENVYGQSFVDERRAFVKKYYNSLIKNRKYNPENPLNE